MTTLITQGAPTNGRSLRPYQVEAMEKMDHAFFVENQTNTVLSLPPSGGKTFVATQWMDTRFLDKGEKVLWLAHREELIEQARDDAMEYCPGHKITTWFKGGKDATGDVIIASVPSFRSLLTAIQEAGLKFGLMVIDECHHAAAETYQAVIEGVPHTKRLGLSGTPKRMDGKHFAFDNIAFQIKFMELVNDGWCARPTYIRFKTKQTHLFQIKLGDFTQGSLKSLNNVPRNEMVARQFFDYPERWPAVVYTVNVDHAWQLRQTFSDEARKRGKSCRVCVVTGETPKEERRGIVQDFRDGKVDVLLNCMVFTEGTDLPTIRSIFLTRPTMSETLYLQMALRGGRSKPGCQATGNDPTPGLKPENKFFIVDFVDSAHHYTAASRGFALRALDPKQVNGQVGIEDIEKQKELVAAVPGAYEEFKKQFRGIKFEDEELTPEEWMLAKVGATVVTSSPWVRERSIVLTAEQDFAVLCGTEYVWKRWENMRLSRSEAVELIRYSHELFAKDQFTLAAWKELMEAWVSHKRFRNAVQPNGGRTWVHHSAVESPPLQEVFSVIEEIEKEAAAVDQLFEDSDDAWFQVSERILNRAAPEHRQYWVEQLARVHNVAWGDKQLSFYFDGSPATYDGWFVEILVTTALRRTLDRDDVRVTMTFKDTTYAPCTTCGGRLVLRESRNGRFFGCTGYPKCNASARMPSRETINVHLRERWTIPN